MPPATSLRTSTSIRTTSAAADAVESPKAISQRPESLLRATRFLPEFAEAPVRCEAGAASCRLSPPQTARRPSLSQFRGMRMSDMPALRATDPEIHRLIALEAKREAEYIRLIPSENYASDAVMEATGSVLANK